MAKKLKMDESLQISHVRLTESCANQSVTLTTEGSHHWCDGGQVGDDYRRAVREWVAEWQESVVEIYSHDGIVLDALPALPAPPAPLDAEDGADAPLFRFSPRPQSRLAHDWVTEADDVDLRGDLDAALDLAQQLECEIELRDAAGWTRGWVHADGDYTLK